MLSSRRFALELLYATRVPLEVCLFANSVARASFFKTLVDHEVTVELKNDISIRGTLKSVDQYLNIKLDDVSVVEEMKYPHLVCCIWAGFEDCFGNFGDAETLAAGDEKRNMGMLGNPLTHFAELGQECLHSRECGPICASPCQCGRHEPVGRRNEKRHVSFPWTVLFPAAY